MSVGHSVRKIAADFNVGLRMCKFLGGYKPKHVGPVLDTSKSNDLLLANQQFNPVPSFTRIMKEFCIIYPKIDVAIQKSIVEPEKSIKINFELPLRNSTVTALDLPLHTEKEIKEPGKVISKKAIYMIRVRKRKMRKHKRKKYLKKYAAELAKTRLRRKMDKEATFQATLRNILNEKESFSAEEYVDSVLEKVHWERPITRVKGQLAPQWVIKQYLKDTQEKENFKQRIKECLK